MIAVENLGGDTAVPSSPNGHDTAQLMLGEVLRGKHDLRGRSWCALKKAQPNAQSPETYL